MQVHSSLTYSMDKLWLKGRNLGRVFSFTSGRVHALRLYFIETKLPNLKLKARAKQLLGSITLDISLHAYSLFCLDLGCLLFYTLT
jgi:hypothetical protein